MNADKMLENEGYVYSNTTFTSDKKTVVNYIDNHTQNRIAFILEDKIWLAENVFQCVTVLDTKVTNAVLKKCEEMGWLESEKKQETNLEHHFEYLSTVGIGGFALINGKCVRCSDTDCTECDFNGDCCKKRLIWLASPYKKPTYKLTQFECDLIKAFNRCKECCLLNEIECLKKLSEKGYFKGIDPFTKIHDIIDNCEVIENGK